MNWMAFFVALAVMSFVAAVALGISNWPGSKGREAAGWACFAVAAVCLAIGCGLS